ncbi:MAG: O-antigen ligase family protein [Bacillota bacterium]
MKKASVASIMILVSASPLFRGLYFSFETYAFLAALALLSILYFLAKLRLREPFYFNKVYAVLGLLLVAAAAAAFAKAVYPRENLGTLLLYVELIALFIVLYDYFHDKKLMLIRAIMMLSLTVGFICAVFGLMALTGRFNFLEVTIFDGRVGSTFQYANTASIYFAVCAIFAISLANTVENVLLKALAAGMGSVVIFGFLMTGSRGGYIVGVIFILLLLAVQPTGQKLTGTAVFACMLLPVFIAMKSFGMSAAVHYNTGAVKWIAVPLVLAAASCLLLFRLRETLAGNRRSTKERGYGFVFIAAAAIAVFAVVYVFANRNGFSWLLPPVLAARFERLVRNGFYENGIAFRLIYDRDALKLIAEHWLFGLGGGGWKALYQSVQDFFYTAAFVHNQYLQVFVDSGVLGFLSYTALVLYSGVCAVRSYLKSRDSDERAYAAGLLCGFFALAVHAFFDFDLSFVSLTLLFWAMFAASTVGNRVAVSKAGGIVAGEAGMQEEAVGDGGKQEVLAVGGDSRQGVSMSGGSGKQQTLAISGVGKMEALMTGSAGKMAMVIICSILFSTNALFFTAALNRQSGFNYMQKKEYMTAILYYEEAHRIDPYNSDYTFELAKLYLYQAKKSNEEEKRATWLEKARWAGEKSVSGNKYYPAYMNTLARIYLESGMPLNALEYAQKVVLYQKYNADNYELLARCYLAAAEYYEKSGNFIAAADMLERCLEIDNDPYLRRSAIERPADISSEKIISEYRHSEELVQCLEEAEKTLRNIKPIVVD